MPQSLYTPFFGDMMGGVADRSTQKRTAGLARDAYMGDPEAIKALAAVDPKLAMQVEDQTIQRKEKTEQANLRTTAEARRVAGEERAVAGEGREAADAFTADVEKAQTSVASFNTFEEAQSYGQRALDFIRHKYPEQYKAAGVPEKFDQAAFDEAKSIGAAAASGAGSEQRFYESLTGDLSPEEAVAARNIELGLAPRAVGSGAITTATQPGLTEQVATSQEEIRERTKFAELTGSSRANAIDAGFTSVKAIDKNIRNLDRGIAALDEGASSGKIESMFPSFKAETIELENVQRELGLDVIGTVTFGALSQGELDLALATAMPKNMSEADLREWLVGRKKAQKVLRDYYIDQMEFLEEGGTVAGFMRKQRKAGPKVGTVRDGYEFTGGDPKSQSSWSPVDG